MLVLPRLMLALCLIAPAGAIAAETRSERLWLPASAQNLRPFLQMAADLALEDTTCTEILYGRLNEYRTAYEEPTFTILCKRDERTTFNKIIPITQVDPDYFARLQASENAASQSQTLSAEVEALRQQLLAPSAVATPPQTPSPEGAEPTITDETIEQPATQP
jgi:hypothetical protein